MGDSQQPKPAAPEFEVPDLELESVPWSTPTRAAAPSAPAAPVRPSSTPDLFDDEAFGADCPTIDLGVDGEHDAAVRSVAVSQTGLSEAGGELPWPSGQTPAREHLVLAASDISRLANFGDPPNNVYLTPLYAYRVFSRQREIKQALVPLTAEHLRAEAEREGVLAELSRAVRAEAEQIEQFRRLFAPLLELEQIASQRGQALSLVNGALSAQANALDAERAEISAQLTAAQTREQDAQGLSDERETRAQRAEAKLKRAHIEIRAIRQVAERKLGPHDGKIAESEVTQLAALERRAEALQAEVNHARAELQCARVSLDRASLLVGAARQNDRTAARQKQALLQRHQLELDVRERGQGESEEQQRALLADLGRALLAAHGSVPVPKPWLERVQQACQRADALLMQCELHVRAAAVYDHARVAQGVRLACTLATLFFLLIVLKIVL